MLLKIKFKKINTYNINICTLYYIYLSYIYNMPVVKQDITKMTVKELAKYVEAVREKRRANSKKYYDNFIKGDPGKCQMFLDKGKKNDKLIIILEIRIILYKFFSKK